MGFYRDYEGSTGITARRENQMERWKLGFRWFVWSRHSGSYASFLGGSPSQGTLGPILQRLIWGNPCGGCPIFLYLKTTLSPCLSRTFRGLSRPKENPQKLHLTTIKASMLTHIILPVRRPFRRAFADLSRPQKSTDFASLMFRLYIQCKQGFRTAPM